MASEIERKFLVRGEYKSYVSSKISIVQGYLSSAPERNVRIRIQGDTGYITIKGAGNRSGLTRFEWEKEIPLADARALINICEPGLIEKTRHIIPEASGLFFEVDEFHGANEGLILAEIELPSEDHPFQKPGWLGPEVSGDLRYYNSMLVKHPFTSW